MSPDTVRAPIPLVDSHCHLDFDWFDEDREAVLGRALEAGITRIVNPGIDLESSKKAITLAESHPGIFAAVGVHPNSAVTWNHDTLRILRELVRHPRVVAIGEIGLDYYRDRAPQPLQEEVFRAQLDLAAEVGLPVIVHNREATHNLLPILVKWQTELHQTGSSLANHPGVLHSFSGEAALAAEILKANFYLGISGPVTFKNALDLQQVVAGLALDRLLTETDAPFLSPHPKRGQRNEPANVRLVAEKISTLHQRPFSVVARKTAENAERLFNWKAY